MNKKKLIILILVMLVIILVVLSAIQFFLFNRVNKDLENIFSEPEYTIIIVNESNTTDSENHKEEILKQDLQEAKIPLNCSYWFDGCNECYVEAGEIVDCSRRECEVYEKPKCLAEFDLSEKEGCFESGGEWKRAGMMGNFHCIHNHPDAGSPCTSSDDCIGPCIVTRTLEEDPKAIEKAFCKYDTNPFGCWSTIERFKEHGAILCRD